MTRESHSEERLREVEEQLGGGRLVYDVQRRKFVGVAYQTVILDRRIVRFEGDGERQFRESAIKLGVNGVGGPAPDSPSAPDTVTTIAGFALSPWHLVRAVVTSAIGIAVRSHLPGCVATVAATVIDSVVSKFLPRGREGLVTTMNDIAAGADISADQMTPLAQKVTLKQVAEVVSTRTAGVPRPAAVDQLTPPITPADLDEIYEQPEPGALPKLDVDLPAETPPPARRRVEDPPDPGSRGMWL